MIDRLYIFFIIGLLLLALIPSCNIDGDLEECPYNVRLEYWYDDGGSANRLTDYVDRIDGFVFDSEGVLYGIDRRSGKERRYGELMVTPGKYTVVSWGNLDTTSRLYPDAQIGKTRLADMQLRASEIWHQVSEKLYYSSVEIDVSGRGVTRERACMTHAHCRLNLSVVWRQNPPEDTGNFSFRLSDAPSRYAFPVSGYIREVLSLTAGGDFRYPLPGFLPERRSICAAGKMNIVRTLSGELCCYRLKDDDHPLLSIYQGETPLIEGIDLWKFFTTMHIGLNNNLRQEFDLRIELDGGKAYISTLLTSDWEEGPTIGVDEK